MSLIGLPFFQVRPDFVRKADPSQILNFIQGNILDDCAYFSLSETSAGCRDYFIPAPGKTG